MMLALFMSCSIAFNDQPRGPRQPKDAADADTDADTDADSDADADTDADTDTDTDPTDPCAALTPSSSASSNRAAIQRCLDTAGYAVLGPGVHAIDLLLDVPAGATLSGSGRTATIQASGSVGNGLLYMRAGSTVRGLVLDANQSLDDTNGAVVQILGSNVTVDDCWIGNVNGHVRGLGLAGVYFMDDTGSGSVVQNSEITNLFYGVIFRAGLDAAEVNTVQASIIHDTACDGVTFAGYGELIGSTLYHHGYDCENGPLPGASVYGLDNLVGARIDSNEMYDDCGNVIDLDTVWSFEITNNTIRDPGYTWGGYAPYCNGSALMIIDSAFNVISGNVISSDDRTNNRLEDTYGPDVYRRNSSAAAFSDLSPGGDAIIAFQLLQRSGSQGATVYNVVDGNELRAGCTSGCTGIGYFSSRGTGQDATEAWSTASSNYFSGNNPSGSNIGSIRCGLNWYAWDDTCDGTFPSGACNEDDHQHVGFLRNDGCEQY